jgi:hypothetical protein
MVEGVLLSVQDMEDEQEGSGVQWLRAEFERVRDAFMSGAKFCTASSFRGQSTTVTKEVRTDFLFAVLTQARRRLEAQGAGAEGAMLIPRLADFPLS